MRILASLVVFLLVVTFHASVEEDMAQARQDKEAFGYSIRSLLLAVISVATCIGVILKF